MKKTSLVIALMSLGLSNFAMADNNMTREAYVNTANNQEVVKTELGTSCLHTSGTKTIHAECGDAVPMPVAPMVIKAPVMKHQVKTLRESFSHETLFAFNSSNLSEQGKTALQSFMSQLDLNDKRLSVELVRATGYTDELGTEKYNEKLSIKRAQAVASYLTAQYNLDVNVVEVEGMGERAAQMGETCRAQLKLGNKPLRATPKVVACLAPDRKVDMLINFTFQE